MCVAFTFFKPAEVVDGKLSGEACHPDDNDAPRIESAPASVECRLVQIVEQGDHHIFVGEVTATHVRHRPEGRPDNAILEMKDLGENVFYGG